MVQPPNIKINRVRLIDALSISRTLQFKGTRMLKRESATRLAAYPVGDSDSTGGVHRKRAALAWLRAEGHDLRGRPVLQTYVESTPLVVIKWTTAQFHFTLNPCDSESQPQ
jgi:hypothetical protein